MKNILKRPVALLLVIWMILPMVTGVAFAAKNKKSITFGALDGNTYLTTEDPKLESGKDFGKWAYLGGLNHSTTKVTGSFIQTNRFASGMWMVLRLNSLDSGKYDLDFHFSLGDAHVYLQAGSQVADMEALVKTLSAESSSYLGQLSKETDYAIELEKDGDYLLIFSGVDEKHFRISRLDMTRTGDTVVPETTTPATKPAGGTIDEAPVIEQDVPWIPIILGICTPIGIALVILLLFLGVRKIIPVASKKKKTEDESEA